MVVEPDAFAWIASSALSEAGCLTIVPAPDHTLLRTAFGAAESPPADLASVDDPWVVGTHEPWASFAEAKGGVVVAEDGFEGSRAEVLKAASAASARGKAANIYWDVNGLVLFSWAQRGEVAGCLDLGTLDHEEVEGLPKRLQRLARTCEDDGGDPVRAGIAMAVQFTGTAFGPDALEDGVVLRLLPVPADLEPFSAAHPPSSLDPYPELVAAIVSMTSEAQRRLAATAAGLAVREAGIGDEPGVASTLATAAPDQRADLDIRAERSRSTLSRRAARQEMDETFNEYAAGFSVELSFLWQKLGAYEALRQTTQASPLAAALGSVSHAIGTIACGTTGRGLVFTEDETGRHLVDSVHSSADRVTQVVRLFQDLVLASADQWEVLLATAPEPFSEDHKASLVAADFEAARRGAFATYAMVWDDEASLRGYETVDIDLEDDGT